MNEVKILSVLIPVYNEENTIKEIVDKVSAVDLNGIGKQIIIVDDHSNDSTVSILHGLEKARPEIKVIYKEKNSGKGSAIVAAIPFIKGEITILQDADLEYDPKDYNILLRPILEGNADAVYGSRFLGTHRAFMFLNLIANKMLNLATNIMYNTTLTDMETCYKMFKSDILKEIRIKSNGFDIEPEITAKILKMNKKIYEVPISYYGRSYEEGKKIKASDGFKAMWTLIKYRFMD
jgi:glycosyltransferase involved in cell wall biosynthesis